MCKKRVFLLIAIVIGISGACNSKPGLTAESSRKAALGGESMEKELVTVKKIDIIILETFPVKVNVNISGAVPDGCTTIGDITSVRDGTVFRITISAERAGDDGCLKPGSRSFEKSVPLDVNGLPAGTYTVEVQGMRTSFALSVDNKLTRSHIIQPEIS